jgi:2-C-methyl-D-erythritol 4-phosphate cytidylyltransferase
MKKTAIIVAGGTGQRMGTTLPKQFLEIGGKSILLHTVNQFVAAFADIDFVIVLPADYIQEGKECVQ